MIRNSRDAGRVETLDDILLLDIPSDHPWHDSKIPLWMCMSATGRDCPGNNPLNRHATLVARVDKILGEWRVTCPKAPKPASTDITYDEFETWHAERANKAKSGDRSSREEDRKAAEKHFQCSIPEQWPREARQNIPDSHPHKTKGRRSS